MIPSIKTAQDFPDVERARHDPNGLLCMGGNLDPQTILTAYSRGIFPWYSAGQPILWWSPDPRMALLPSEFKLSKSLAKTIRANKFEVRFNTAFASVISACSKPRSQQSGTWILPAMQAAYIALHQIGFAHSAEAWRDGKLVGGLYGIALGRVFYGESMFARETDASKVAFAAIVEKLTRDGFQLIDCQQETKHLASFGAHPIPRKEFTQRLQELITLNSDRSPVSYWTL